MDLNVDPMQPISKKIFIVLWCICHRWAGPLIINRINPNVLYYRARKKVPVQLMGPKHNLTESKVGHCWVWLGLARPMTTLKKTLYEDNLTNAKQEFWSLAAGSSPSDLWEISWAQGSKMIHLIFLFQWPQSPVPLWFGGSWSFWYLGWWFTHLSHEHIYSFRL